MSFCKCSSEANKSASEYSFYHKVAAFFDGDPNIRVSIIKDYEFSIYVSDKKKYEVLTKVLYIPENTKLKVHIEYTGENKEVSEEDLAYLLKDNPYYSTQVGQVSTNGLTPPIKFVCMKPVVVQYYDDIFNNPWGFDTKTAEALAKELFYGCKCNITSDEE